MNKDLNSSDRTSKDILDWTDFRFQGAIKHILILSSLLVDQPGRHSYVLCEGFGAPSQKPSFLGGVAQILIYLRPSPCLVDVGLFVRPKSQHCKLLCFFCSHQVEVVYFVRGSFACVCFSNCEWRITPFNLLFIVVVVSTRMFGCIDWWSATHLHL